MSEVATLSGHEDKKDYYADIASEYLAFWMDHAIKADAAIKHSMLQYDEPETHGESPPPPPPPP